MTAYPSKPKEPVLITTITANDNRYSGLNVDNCLWNGSACDGVGGITLASLSGSENIFIGNTYNGVSLYSGKNILLTNIRAENNDDTGIWAANNYTGSIGNITITATTGKFNTASSNGQDGDGDGVILNSFGTVSVSRLIADANNGRGMTISNESAATAKAVTVSDSTFTNNQSDGLYIYSKGLITLRALNLQTTPKATGIFPSRAERSMISCPAAMCRTSGASAGPAAHQSTSSWKAAPLTLSWSCAAQMAT